MPGIRRAARSIEAERRAFGQRVRLGDEVRAMRERRGWTRVQLAERAGIGRMVVGRIERGATNPDLEVLQRLSVAFDQALLVTFGRDLAQGPTDGAHLAMQELILRLAREAGYTRQVELSTLPGTSWRSADVALASDPRRTLLLTECWNTIDDVGSALRSSDRKRADLEAVAAGRWGPDATVRLLWVVRGTARNRALVAAYPEVFASRFSGSSRAWVDTLTTSPSPAPPDGDGLVWCDAGATRISEWRHRHMQ